MHCEIATSRSSCSPSPASVAARGPAAPPLRVLLEGGGLLARPGDCLGWGLEGPGALGLEILVGDEAGGLSLVRDGEVVAVRELGGEVGDLAPGPGGTWFALDLASRRLVLLDRDLGLLWAVDHGLAALELAPVVGEERVWLVDSTEPLVRRYGPGGGLEVEAGMPAADATGATDDGQGGLWVASAGALLRLDVHGAVQPGQGGFGHLTDVSRTP